MDYKELLALEKRTHCNCRVCPVCNGVACKGETPGVGGIGSGVSFINNRKALDKIELLQDCISDVSTVDTCTTLFGVKVDSPVMIAPIGSLRVNYGIDMDEYEYFHQVMCAANDLNIIAFGGDGTQLDYFEKPLQVMDHYHGRGIPTMKPWVQEGLDLRFPLLDKYKHLALAMDVDSAGLLALQKSKIPVECKSVDKLKMIVNHCANRPFIVKGIMSVEGALKAVQAGASGIIISNHGGRVMDGSAGSMDVVKDIVTAVKGKCTILVDGGFRDGCDVFKALALGCDGVLIGRPFALACGIAKAEGVKAYYQHVKSTLIHTMKMCGYATIDAIDDRCIHKVGGIYERI